MDTAAAQAGCAAGWTLGCLAGFLPAAAFMALTTVRATRGSAPGRWRESLLVAAAGTGAWVVLGSEVLSLLGALSFWPVAAWWGLPTILLLAAAWSRRGSLRDLLAWPRNVPWPAWVIAGATVLIVLLAGVVAACSPPNTPDALTYHMPRQVYWMQERSVWHFPTANVLQTAMPPMAEFAGLHLMVLSGSDVFAPLVQWWALALTCLGATLLARELGAGALGQSMAGLLVVANPMAWLQASSVKNDLVTALWIMILACWAARILRDGQCGPGRWALLGSAAGLAVLTKLTGGMFALPVLALVAVSLMIRRKLAWLGLAATVLVITLMLNGPHWWRNMQVYESPLATSHMRWDSGKKSHGNETFAPAAIASNILRNLALHGGTPWPRATAAIDSALRWAHQRLGADVNDPRTTAYADFRITYEPGNEASAGAPVHLLLIVAAAMVLLASLALSWSSRAPTPIGIPRAEAIRMVFLLAAAAAGGLTFCILLKWQPWHARLHLPLVAVLGAIAAAVLVRGHARGLGAILLCGLLLVPLIPSMLWNPMRPLAGPWSVLVTPRDQLLLRGRPPEVRQGLDEAVRFAHAAKAQTVGMRVRLDYAFQWWLIRGLDQRPRFTLPLAAADRPTLRPWPTADLLIDERGQFPRFKDRTSGEMLYLVGESGPYRFLATLRSAEELQSAGLIQELPGGR